MVTKRLEAIFEASFEKGLGEVDLTGLHDLDSGLRKIRVFEYEWVEAIVIGGDATTKFPEKLLEFPKLKSISIKRSRISDLSILSHAIGIDQLIIFGNENLSTLPASIGLMDNLKLLICNHNSIATIPPNILLGKRLRIASFANNQIDEFRADEVQSPHFRELNVSGNKIQSLPEISFSLQGLRMLNVGRNRIVSIPGSVRNLKRLHWFSLSHNLVSEMPDAIAELTSLRTLELDNNSFRTIPMILYRTPMLNDLALIEGNEISCFEIEAFRNQYRSVDGASLKVLR